MSKMKESIKLQELIKSVEKVDTENKIEFDYVRDKNWWSVAFYNATNPQFAVIVDSDEDGYALKVDDRGDSFDDEPKIYKTKSGVANKIKNTLLGGK